VLPIKVDADKLSRVYAVTPMCECGRVFLPVRAPWLDAFVDELLMFPSGPHDDQVDSMTQALNYLRDEAYSGDFRLIPIGSLGGHLEGRWLGLI